MLKTTLRMLSIYGAVGDSPRRFIAQEILGCTCCFVAGGAAGFNKYSWPLASIGQGQRGDALRTQGRRSLLTKLLASQHEW